LLFFSKEEAESLIGPYIEMETTETMSETMGGDHIFWHSWNFVIQK